MPRVTAERSIDPIHGWHPPPKAKHVNEFKKCAISWVCGGCFALTACAGEAAPGEPMAATSLAGTGGPAAPIVAGTGPSGPVTTAEPRAGVGGIPSPSAAGRAAAGVSAPAPVTSMAGTGGAGTNAPAAGGGGMSGLPRAGSGSTRRGGLAGSLAPAPAPVMATNPSECPAAPTDATPESAAALAAVNTVRIAAGAGCVNLVNTLSLGAQNHCHYYVMYPNGDPCIADPHGEVMTCAGFTGASPGARSKAAGYTLGGGGEVMAFFNNPQSAVDIWVNSVWHRTPILDPSTGDLGYGAAAGCDVIDFGRGVMADPSTLVVYPFDGQTDVRTNFDGSHEGPMPPAPTTGWPSASPISIHAKAVMVTEHTLTLDGDATPIEHVWLDATATIVADNMRRQLSNVNFMYANKPFTANTKYRVKLVGTYAGGMFTKEWTFTTGAARRF